MQNTRGVPAPIRMLNVSYRGVRRFGRNPLQLRKYRLFDKASRKAGDLTDFGDSRFESGLDRLLASIEEEDRLNGLGRVMAMGHITNLLRQRLAMTAHLAAHPEVHDERIERPIFIIGAPRTGTTITHHLLSQDECFRFPFTWECDEVHPPLDPDTMDHDPRIKRSQKNLDRMLKLAPGIDAAHPIGAWEAQECALLHAYEFHSGTFHSMFNCQSYDRWLVDQEATWVYEQEKLMLQYMQSGGLRPAEGWLLKTPAHMEHIDAILSVFPDARFVTTYREPTEVIASCCSLIRTLIQLVEDHPDWHDLGRHIVWRMGVLLDRNVELRRRFSDHSEQFIDFPMRRMVDEPLACVTEIYQQFEIPFAHDTHVRMEEFMKGRNLTTRKPHVYDPDDYGLDIADLWPRFESYRDFYGIESVMA
jgi:Sulfotransferase family